MGSAQVGAIRRMVLSLVHAQERNARNVENLYARVSVFGQADTCWVDVALGEVNFAYPYRKGPLGFLKGRGVKALPALAIAAFEPGQSATLSFGPCKIERLARFVDALLIAVHALPAKDYGIDVDLASSRRPGTVQLVFGNARPVRHGELKVALEEARETTGGQLPRAEIASIRAPP